MLAWIICGKHVWLNMTCIATHPSMYTPMSDDKALQQRLRNDVYKTIITMMQSKLHVTFKADLRSVLQSTITQVFTFLLLWL